MKQIIVAWCNSDADKFEKQVPLTFIGERNQLLGFKNNINVLILDGLGFLDSNYKSGLKDLGYQIHDLSTLYNEFSNKYTALNRFGDYEKKCFLRWLVINKYMAGESIIHYDGDIVFNEDPNIIEKKVKDFTFILKGCPAFTVINNQDWFAAYIEQLNLFTKDIEGYSSTAWKQRDGWELTNETKWAGSRFREIISSDQDFLSHLIHTDLIYQSKPEEIIKNFDDNILFENPLWPDQVTKEIPFLYIRLNGIDYLNERKVLLWHMQTSFNFYLARFIFRKKFLKYLSHENLPLDLYEQNMETLLNKKVNRITSHIFRLNVYNYFFKLKDFSEIFNSQIWWDKNIFR